MSAIEAVKTFHYRSKCCHKSIFITEPNAKKFSKKMHGYLIYLLEFNIAQKNRCCSCTTFNHSSL